MLEFYTYLFANRSQFERMQRNSKIPNIIVNTFSFYVEKNQKKCREFFMLDNLLWGMSCKVSPNPIICCHQTYPVNLAFIGLLTFEFLFPNKLQWTLYFPSFLLKELLSKPCYCVGPFKILQCGLSWIRSAIKLASQLAWIQFRVWIGPFEIWRLRKKLLYTLIH